LAKRLEYGSGNVSLLLTQLNLLGKKLQCLKRSVRSTLVKLPTSNQLPATNY
jgi:hypothetical protein